MAKSKDEHRILRRTPGKEVEGWVTEAATLPKAIER